jgi:hypothetical protein
MEVSQLMTPQPLDDPNNPVPVDWVVCNTLVADVQTKVIWSNQQNVGECKNCDALLQQAAVRLCASAMVVEARAGATAAMQERENWWARLRQKAGTSALKNCR